MYILLLNFLLLTSSLLVCCGVSSISLDVFLCLSRLHPDPRCDGGVEAAVGWTSLYLDRLTTLEVSLLNE